MVVIKPPSYQLRPISRDNGGISLSRALLYLVLGIGVIVASEHYHTTRGLRGEASTENASTVKTADAVVTVKTADAAVASPPPPPKATNPPPAPAPAPLVPKGKLCERNIGIDLSDPSKWPTLNLPSYFDKEPESDEALVLIKDTPFGNTLIVGLFHALDLAYDKKCGVMITKDADWIWDKLTPWVYGEKARDDAFYKSMEEIFGIKVVNTLIDAEGLKKTIHKIGSQYGLYARSATLQPDSIRNRRDTIYRKLLAYNPQCGGINAAGMNKPDAKYTVIDVPISDAWNTRFDQMIGKDHTAAHEMKPDYVKSILKSVNLDNSPVFLGKSQSGYDLSRVEVKQLEDDTAIQTQEKDVANDLYMAVLADCFIGSPANHWSLMVARMRYALGMANTFVLTSKAGETWTSDVGEDHLVLHTPDSMGLWFG